MSRKRWLWGVSCLLLIGVLLTGGVTFNQEDVAVAAPNVPAAAAVQVQAGAGVEQIQPGITPNGAYLWNYSIKFVCGTQAQTQVPGHVSTGEPLVKPGNYATEINIHNYNYREVKVRKKLLVLAGMNAAGGTFVMREPESIKQPNALDAIVLNPDGATLDDCNRLWKLAGVNPTPPPLTIGYLVVLSPIDLDIDAVYTAEVSARVGTATDVAQPMGISIDVQRVQGKRVFVPTSVLAQFP